MPGRGAAHLSARPMLPRKLEGAGGDLHRSLSGDLQAPTSAMLIGINALDCAMMGATLRIEILTICPALLQVIRPTVPRGFVRAWSWRSAKAFEPRRRTSGCVSACKFGSDSFSMQFGS